MDNERRQSNRCVYCQKVGMLYRDDGMIMCSICGNKFPAKREEDKDMPKREEYK